MRERELIEQYQTLHELGNPFDRAADVRVNTVNCVGVMGKGIALEFKKWYPKER